MHFIMSNHDEVLLALDSMESFGMRWSGDGCAYELLRPSAKKAGWRHISLEQDREVTGIGSWRWHLCGTIPRGGPRKGESLDDLLDMLSYNSR